MSDKLLTFLQEEKISLVIIPQIKKSLIFTSKSLKCDATNSHHYQACLWQSYNKGLGPFVGLDCSLTFLGITDPAEVLKTGYNGNKNVSVWNNLNRLELIWIQDLITINFNYYARLYSDFISGILIYKRLKII